MSPYHEKKGVPQSPLRVLFGARTPEHGDNLKKMVVKLRNQEGSAKKERGGKQVKDKGEARD